VPAVPHGDFLHYLLSMLGLGGQEEFAPATNVVYQSDDPVANLRYLELKRLRGQAV